MATEVLQTATQVAIVDNQLNAWELFAGEDINVFSEYKDDTTDDQYDYWGYRGQSCFCKRSTDDAIVRLRIGTPGDTADRNIYRQIVTSPEVSSQWESWSLLYSGTFYSVGIQRDANEGAGYSTYYSTLYDVYCNGVTRSSVNNVFKIRPMPNKPKAVWYAFVALDADSKTGIYWLYSDDIINSEYILSHSFYYPFTSADMFGISSNGVYNRFWAIPYGQNPRVTGKSAAIILDQGSPADLTGSETTRYFITQSSERAGQTIIKDLFYTEDLDDYNHLFFTKQQLNSDDEPLHNLESPLFYSKNISPTEAWTEPMPTGFSLWGFAGVVAAGDYIYAIGNGAVYRRPVATITTELSDYVISGGLDLNPTNQKSTANLTLANPHNEAGALLGYNPTSNTDNTICSSIGGQIRIRLGQKRSYDTGYIYGEPNNWWISQINRSSSNNQDRLEITCEDFWKRLETPYITDFYYPGKVNSRDWVVDAPNTVDNYFMPESEKVITTAAGPDDSYPVKMKLTRTKWSLDTRWRLWDGSVSMRIQRNSDQTATIGFRYINPNNFHRVKIDADGTVTVGCYYHGRSIIAGLVGGISPSSGLTDFIMKVSFRGDHYQVWVDDIYAGYQDYSEWFTEMANENVISVPRSGFVGARVGTSEIGGVAYSMDWQVENFEEELTTGRILRKALGHAGFLRSSVDDTLEDTEQIEILMGPQTDLPDPSKVLEKLQEGTALQTVWLADLNVTSLES